MQIDIRRHDDIAIADLSGRLVAGDPQETLREAVEGLLAEDCSKILLNVSGLARLDSSGVGELVALLRTARAVEARVALLQPHDTMRRILDVSQVLPLFETYADEASAIEAMSGS